MRIGICEAAARLPRRDHPLHRRALGDDVGEGERAGGGALHALELALERAELQGVLDRHLEPLGRDRLDHEIDRAGPHRVDHRVDPAMGGLDDHGNRPVLFPEPGEHTDPVELGHDEIEDDEGNEVALRSGEVDQRLLAACRGRGAIAEPLDGMGEEPTLDGIVVNDEDGGGHDAGDDRRRGLMGC